MNYFRTLCGTLLKSHSLHKKRCRERCTDKIRQSLENLITHNVNAAFKTRNSHWKVISHTKHDKSRLLYLRLFVVDHAMPPCGHGFYNAWNCIYFIGITFLLKTIATSISFYQIYIYMQSITFYLMLFTFITKVL